MTDSQTRLGRVIAHHGQTVLIQTPNHDQWPCQYRSQQNALVTGDWVHWQPDPYDPSQGIIVNMAPRNNVLARPHRHHRQAKPLAANIYQALIVIAGQPAPIAHYIDRYLVALKTLHIKPVLVINKMDQWDLSNQALKQFKTIYQSLNYPVYAVSATTGLGIESLQSQLNHQTSILLGQSGVGKSALLNALAETHLANTGTVSTKSRLGKHTTTTAYLHTLPLERSIIDAPGIRQFNCWHLTAHDIRSGFIEFAPFDCRFRDCWHLESSAGCQVRSAYEQGHIATCRLDSYYRLLNEVTQQQASYTKTK